MVTIDIDYISQSLKRKTDFTILLPENITPTNIVLLLHGRGDNKEAWIQYTNIVRYNKNSLIILPSGDISFYLNRKHGEQFQDYLIELLEFVQSKFNLKSPKIHIAGNSMGGFGSLMLAKKASFNIDSIGLFSPALSLSDQYLETYPDTMLKEQLKSVVSDPDKIQSIAPKIFLYCGKEDKFFEQCAQFAKDYNVKLYFDEHGHDWDAWDKWIKIYMERI